MIKYVSKNGSLKFLSLFLLFSSYSVLANVVVEQPYVRAMPSSAVNSAAFMVLSNHSEQSLKLLSATSPVAKVVELHTHKMENGVMKMRQIPFIEIPARGKTTLAPGGLHIMLMGLLKPVNEGDEVKLELSFSDGSVQSIQVAVKKVMHMMKHQH